VWHYPPAQQGVVAAAKTRCDFMLKSRRVRCRHHEQPRCGGSTKKQNWQRRQPRGHKWIAEIFPHTGCTHSTHEGSRGEEGGKDENSQEVFNQWLGRRWRRNSDATGDPQLTRGSSGTPSSRRR
jgi:hypothetical protein